MQFAKKTLSLGNYYAKAEMINRLITAM